MSSAEFGINVEVDGCFGALTLSGRARCFLVLLERFRQIESKKIFSQRAYDQYTPLGQELAATQCSSE